MTEIESVLRTISAGAVIAGTILVVLQLRVNAKQARARTAFDLIGKVIDPSFAARRHLLYVVAEKHTHGNWTGFDRSLEDFEVRNFASIYEPLADWTTFQPIRMHIMEEAGKAFPALGAHQPGVESIYWPSFKWLAEESRKWTLHRVPAASS